MESALAFLAGAMAIGAAMYVWGWGTAQIAFRQPAYEMSRLAAGGSSRSVDSGGASGGCISEAWPVYKPFPLP